jgi:hypothetical protein
VASREEWAEAYAKQSRSDWLVYEKLSADPSIAACHALHYLQMACEKIAKAYRYRDTQAEALHTAHVGFPAFINSFLVSPKVLRRLARRRAPRESNAIAREIERLAPAVDQGTAPENSEYPWATDQGVVVPCEYGYPNLVMLTQPSGLRFLRLVKMAVWEFDTLSIH